MYKLAKIDINIIILAITKLEIAIFYKSKVLGA
jgi:hypothetical protein